MPKPLLLGGSWQAEAASSRWPSRRWLDDVPPEVLAISSWPVWRRVLLRPPEEVKGRVKAWRDLASCHRIADDTRPPFPAVRSKGIFGESRTYWQLLVGYDGRGTRFEGLKSCGNRVSRSTFVNPHGALVLSTSLEDFQCDITDVEGISASKSSSLHFDNVDAFGRYFNEHKRAPVTPEGLAMMLRHGEIRIIHSSGVDAFSVTMWDGRLFLDNHGGSHHFAGAAYIAKAIGQPVPLSAQLNVRHLNVPAWNWLIERFHLLHASSQQRHWYLADATRLVGETYKIELTESLGGGDLVLLPRTAPTIRSVIGVLAHKSIADVTSYFENILMKQAEIQRRWAARLRWPDDHLRR